MYTAIYDAILEFVKMHLMTHVVLLLLASSMMVFSMAIDLIFGVRKAKKNGYATTSTGFKKTCDKARKYFSPYMVLICIDCITAIVVPIPVFSLLWAAYCVFCEFTSVREKAWQKEEMRKAEHTMRILVENKDDLAKMVAQLLTQQANTDTPSDGPTTND